MGVEIVDLGLETGLHGWVTREEVQEPGRARRRCLVAGEYELEFRKPKIWLSSRMKGEGKRARMQACDSR